jgi:hypothetical protein
MMNTDAASSGIADLPLSAVVKVHPIGKFIPVPDADSLATIEDASSLALSGEETKTRQASYSHSRSPDAGGSPRPESFAGHMYHNRDRREPCPQKRKTASGCRLKMTLCRYSVLKRSTGYPD